MHKFPKDFPRIQQINIKEKKNDATSNYDLASANQSTRKHEDDLRWMNRYVDHFKDNLIKKYLNKIKRLQEKTTNTGTKQQA
ncbi:unnamed protein product [Rotaria sordida]|uniref:Uncharacterized protein n=1 Tax=Rotaria sordida TaxID=392033 RepID=A0A813Y1M3_9BILA|nr:unnamed protein product [Rotaria sordida]